MKTVTADSTRQTLAAPDRADSARSSATGEVEQNVAQLYRAVYERIRSLAKKFNPDLQPAGFGILRYIKATQPVRAGDIAQALGMDKSAVSRQVAVLREMGLVETKADPQDGRAFLLVMSEVSFSALDEIRDEATADYDRILADWPTEEITQFARLLGRFNGSL